MILPSASCGSMPMLEDLAAFCDVPCRNEKEQQKQTEEFVATGEQSVGPKRKSLEADKPKQTLTATAEPQVRKRSLFSDSDDSDSGKSDFPRDTKRQEDQELNESNDCDPCPPKKPKQSLIAEPQVRKHSLFDSDDSDSGKFDSPRDTESDDSDKSNSPRDTERQEKRNESSDPRAPKKPKQTLTATAEPQVRKRNLFSDSDDSDSGKSDSPLDTVGFHLCF
ncbi:uncharacterized protein LOC134773994 [Penaeus indicus]|uniref:uncharacterized protein LOC134773994 n=1 Tax=Penaeus indicus TaxID=29960 RepID=UPI00300CEE7E